MAPLSSTERQRAYRQRLKEGTDVRLDVVVSAEAVEALDRLAKIHSTTKRDVLERLLIAAGKVSG